MRYEVYDVAWRIIKDEKRVEINFLTTVASLKEFEVT